MMKHIEKSIQLISYNLLKGKFEINNKALQFLQNLGKPFAITTITGSICSGKSYLLNQIIGEQQFIVGSKSISQTKGIWLSKTPLLSLDQQYYHVFLDGQGLSSIDKDSDYDIKLLLLSIMVSSTLIYNSFGAIEQSSLQIIRGSIALKKYCHGEWGQISPTNLIWSARDFNLQLEDKYGNSITQQDYLQNALKEIQGQNKTDTKYVLRQTFPKRRCYTLPRPTINEQILRNLSSHHKRIKPQFLSKIAEIRKDIFCESQLKQKQGHVISPQIYSSMMKSLIKIVNNIGTLSASTWSSISQQNNQKVFQNCVCRFSSRLSSLQLPLSNDNLNQTMRRLFQQTQKQYNSNSFGYESMQQELVSTHGLSQLKKIMQKQMDSINEVNAQLLKKQSQMQFQQLLSNFHLGSFIQSPQILRIQLNSKMLKLKNSQQYKQFSQYLINIIQQLGQRIKKYQSQHQNDIQQLDKLKADYDSLKNIHSNTFDNILLLQTRNKSLQQSIKLIQQQKGKIKIKLQQSLSKSNLNGQDYQLIKQQFKKSSIKINQLQSQNRQFQKQLCQQQKQNQQQIKIFIQQKKVFQEQQKFYEKQIVDLKSNIDIVKNNFQRSSEGLLQNNQIIQRLENMRNKNQKHQSILFDKQNKQGEQRKIKQLKIQIVGLDQKIKRSQITILQLSEKLKKQQQMNIILRTELNSQLGINKQLETSKRSYEEMIGSLENNLTVIEASQQRQKKLYQESVLRLIQNIEKREEQYHRRDKKSQFRQRLSRHQY